MGKDCICFLIRKYIEHLFHKIHKGNQELFVWAVNAFEQDYMYYTSSI